MFCPKCGTKLPDDAKFCGNCGATVGGSKPSPVSNNGGTPDFKAAASHLASKTKGVQLNPAGGVTVGSIKLTQAQLIVLICAVIAIICAFMPWVNTPAADYQASQYVSDGLNGLSSLTGGDGTAGTAYRLKESYAMWELPQMIRAYSGYGAGSAKGMNELLGIWAVGLLVFAFGVFQHIRDGRRRSTVVGGIVLGFLPVALVMQGSRSGDGAPIWPMLCLVFIVATILCEFLLSKPAPKAKAKAKSAK